MKPPNSETISSHTRWPWRLYLLVASVALLVTATLIFSLRAGAHLTEEHAPQVEAIMVIKYQTAMAHLCLEKVISGNKQNEIEKTWKYLKESRWYAQALLEGGTNHKGEFCPIEDSYIRLQVEEVLAKLYLLDTISHHRISGNRSAAIENQFNNLFNSLIKQADDIEMGLHNSMNEDLSVFRTLQTSLIMACLILGGIVAVILHRFKHRNRQSALALQKSENSYQSIFETSPNMIISLDPNGVLVNCNELFAQTLGYDRDELIGKSPDVFIHPSSMSSAVEALQTVFTKGILHNHGHKMVRKDGEVIDVVINSSAQRGTDGKYARTICTLEDVTSRLKAEEEQLKSQQRLRLIIEQAPIGMIEFNLNFEIVAWNPAAEKIFGYTKKEALGNKGGDLLVPQSAKHLVDEVWNQICKDKGGYHSTNQNVTKDERTILCEWYNTPLVDTTGTVIGVTSIVEDITETKRLQELESRAQRLQSAGQIAGQVAHDFNNLLAPLVAYPEFIREELSEDHPALQYLNDIENSAKKIANINQQLLSLGRRGHYNVEPININEIIEDVIRESVPYPDSLKYHTLLDQNLMNINGGEAQIHRVISNLLINARDAMNDFGQITVKTENYYIDNDTIVYDRIPRGEYVKVTISDTGCGIPDDEIEKIFDPFVTSKPTDDNRGSGLGLSVVDSVIKDHDSFIDLKSTVGKGTTFYLYFPITRDINSKPETIPANGGNETILIVDDDRVQRNVCERLLRKMGYAVEVAISGEQAIEMLDANSYDLLILDMVMPPGIDGVETYRRARTINPDQRAIIVSGFSESNSVREAQALGAGDFVKKPLTASVIAAAVRKELERETATVV